MPGLTEHLFTRHPRPGRDLYLQRHWYPFKVEYLDVGYAIDDVDLKGVSPITLVALQERGYQDG